MKYPHKESAILEFKRVLPHKLQTILKTVVAFANTYGGHLIIGIDDDGSIIGINEQRVDEITDAITHAMYDTITPFIFPSIYTKRIGENLILIIDIAEGSNKPYHFVTKGLTKSTYVRLGAHSILATNDMIAQLQWLGRRKFLDEMPVYEATQDDIDLKAFQDFLDNRRQENKDINIQEMLFHYNILVKERARIHPTIGGLLLFGKQPEKFYPEAFIICSHFSGTSGRDAIATRDSTGNLLQQFKDTIAFILSRLNTSYKIVGADRREEKLELPPEAIREVVINAIVHRNYQIMGPSKIAIYDDRLEFFSPGNFPGPILADKVDIGVTYIRNAIVTRVFRDLGIIEKLGSGFITLFESYAKNNLSTPVVTEGVGFVKCILPRSIHLGTPLHEIDDKKLLYLFITRNELSVKDVMQYFSVSRSTASRLLTKFTDEGVLARSGQGPATRYKRLI